MSTPPSKGEYLWTASGICLQECVEERALGLPPFADPSQATDADMPAAAKYGDGLMPALQKKLKALEQLPFPAAVPLTGEVALIRVALEHFRKKVEEFDAANRAAHVGDAASFRRHWITGREHAVVADSLWETYGLPGCAAD